MKPIGVFGGTFDPVHYGHLRSAFEMLQALDFEEVRFIPCSDPPHRGVTYATAAQRYRLVEVAITGQPGFTADDRELTRGGPSYTVDTLATLRTEFPDRSVGLTMPTCTSLLNNSVRLASRASPETCRSSALMWRRWSG